MRSEESYQPDCSILVIELGIVEILKQFLYREVRIFQHILIENPDEFRLEEIVAHHLVGDILYFSDMKVELPLRGGIEIGHVIKTQQVETDEIGYDILSLHRFSLALVIIFLIQGVVGSQVLVKADTHRLIAHHDTLVEGAYLCIGHGHLDIRYPCLERMESVGELGIEVAHVGILHLGIRDDRLQSGVLVEPKEFGVDLRVTHIAKSQNILYEGTSLVRIVSAHLLERGEVASGEIQTLQAVVTLDGDLHGIAHYLAERLQFEVACSEYG